MDVFKLLKQPYVFAFASAVLSTLLAYMYSKTIKVTQQDTKKFCCKTAVFALASNMLLAYLSSRPDSVLTEPFYGP